MKSITKNFLYHRIAALWLIGMAVAFYSIQIQAGTVLHVPDEFTTIQEAIDTAQPGDIIQVAPGTYQENVVIDQKNNLSLLGRNSLLDGYALGGIGVYISGSSNIYIEGFIVEKYEAGIVLEGTEHSRIHNNETRFNDSSTASLRDGLQLVGSHYNVVSNLYSHDNGHNGITLKQDSSGVGSKNNVIFNSRSNDNGKNLNVAAVIGGCGIQLISSDNHNNFIGTNLTLRNGWGIQVGGGSNDNKVLQNRSHKNARAGVVVLDSGSNNLIGQNNARGNGLENVTPSLDYDLFDQGVLNNTWVNNKGKSNF